MQSTENKIVRRISSKGHGWCFTPQVFLDLGSSDAIRQGLSRLERRSVIRRLAHGLYEYPQRHPEIGLLAPSPEAVARALAERDGAIIQSAGAYAANLLGLSEQIPAKVVFLTSGPSRRVRLGKQEILLKHSVPRNMATAGRISGTVIQALRHLGQQHVTQGHLDHLRRILGDAEKRQLWNDRVHAPAWMHRHLKAIAGEQDA